MVEVVKLVPRCVPVVVQRVKKNKRVFEQPQFQMCPETVQEHKLTIKDKCIEKQIVNQSIRPVDKVVKVPICHQRVKVVPKPEPVEVQDQLVKIVQKPEPKPLKHHIVKVCDKKVDVPIPTYELKKIP